MKKIRPMNDTVRDMPLLTLGMNKVSLPTKTQVLSVGYDEEEILQLTVILDEGRDIFQDRGFYVATKGMRMPSGMALTHLGSPRRPGRIAVHVFEVNSPEDGVTVGVKRGVTVSNHQEGPVNGPSFQVGVLGGGVNVVRRPDKGVYVQ